MAVVAFALLLPWGLFLSFLSFLLRRRGLARHRRSRLCTPYSFSSLQALATLAGSNCTYLYIPASRCLAHLLLACSLPFSSRRSSWGWRRVIQPSDGGRSSLLGSRFCWTRRQLLPPRTRSKCEYIVQRFLGTIVDAEGDLDVSGMAHL